MVEAIMGLGFTMPNSLFHTPSPHATKMEMITVNSSAAASFFSHGNCLSSRWNMGWSKNDEKMRRRASLWKVNALPDWPLMAVIVEHVEGQRDVILHKSLWHLSDETMKNIYTMYIMFTCWGCCFFGSTKDPFYDGEQYREDGGDGTGHWVYEKQEDIEEGARAELWREELIEEIEQKVGGLRELEEAGKKDEELVR